MIVNARQLEGKRNGLTELLEQAAHVGLDRIEALNLLIIVHEHVTINLVNEDLIPYVRFDLACALNNLKELLASGLVIRIVRINHIDKCTAVLNMLNGVRLQHVVAREVNNVELDVVIVADGLRLYVACWQKEESFMRRHLLKDNL